MGALVVLMLWVLFWFVGNAIGTAAWNFVMPLFGLPVLTFWQFFVLNFVTHILFSQISFGASKK